MTGRPFDETPADTADAAAGLRGTYRHFKGGFYEVVGLARHSETEEELVVYRSPAGDLWVRPRAMFFETAVVDGVSVPRFSRVTGPKSVSRSAPEDIEREVGELPPLLDRAQGECV